MRCLTLSILLFVTLSPAANATGEEPPPAGANENKADHDAIRKLRDDVVAALEQKDADALLNHLHPDVVLTAQDGTELKVIRRLDGVRDYIDRLLTGPEPGVASIQVAPQVDELTILYGGDTGVAFGSSLDHYVMADGSEFDLPTRWSVTLVKQAGDWKIANLHVSSNLFDNPVLAAAKRAALLIGVASAATGLLVGLVVMGLFKRRRSA